MSESMGDGKVWVVVMEGKIKKERFVHQNAGESADGKQQGEEEEEEEEAEENQVKSKEVKNLEDQRCKNLEKE